MGHNVRQYKVVEVTGLNLVAGTSLFAQAVVGLADVVRLVNRFPLLLSTAVNICPSYFSYRASIDFPQVAQ